MDYNTAKQAQQSLASGYGFIENPSQMIQQNAIAFGVTVGQEKIKWMPWKVLLEDAAILSVDGPPCKHCANWRPAVRLATTAQLCHADEQYKDFSCFRE